MDDNTKVYSCDDPPIPVPDIVMEQQRLAKLISFILIVFVHMKNLSDRIVNFKVEINDLKTKLNKSQFEKLIKSDKNCLFYTNIDKIALFDLLSEKIAPLIRMRCGTTDTRERIGSSSPHQKRLYQTPNFLQKMNSF